MSEQISGLRRVAEHEGCQVKRRKIAGIGEGKEQNELWHEGKSSLVGKFLPLAVRFVTVTQANGRLD